LYTGIIIDTNLFIFYLNFFVEKAIQKLQKDSSLAKVTKSKLENRILPFIPKNISSCGGEPT
jgi:hypothetical protein